MTSYQNHNNNYSGGDYNGGAGGFSNSNYNDTTSAGGFGESSQSKPALRQSITPVTLKQISRSTQLVPDGEFTVGNLELSMVSFVGIIRNVIDNTGNVVLTVEDGTGSMDIKLWVDSTDSAVPPNYELNKYAHFTGSLRQFGGKKTVQNATVKQIIDHNEVTYHFLSAIEAYLASQGATQKNQSEGLFVSGPDGSEMGKSDVDRVYSFITQRAGSMPEGVPMQLIATSLGLRDDEVTGYCQRLTEDGKIYQGYDDNGYLAI
ncbi:hypothetical protein BABINDRAFT_166273 [Babjeviella inositovora NRRL Y-12698]|uniref:Replication protein A C-terminal domain-containing protein n=1 Tax=Babjeviella inositovora NRRL Y-12698 TaxID=984486 RepID=A0A1E3QSJ2_9ASCO|nr:uncharacterized protein BABINDRAFT_166273 [Babjeviella inositovora NRRL Y-12698]ODQ80673.1 hypothetical protein BABINDRAFT_166273 [Babjeviella inositovora NRRL Y-12698]